MVSHRPAEDPHSPARERPRQAIPRADPNGMAAVSNGGVLT